MLVAGELLWEEVPEDMRDNKLETFSMILFKRTAQKSIRLEEQKQSLQRRKS